MTSIRALEPNSFKNLKTLGDFLRFAVSRAAEKTLFCGHGSTQIWDDLAVLILGLCNLPHDSPDWIWQTRLLDQEKQDLLEGISRRIEDRVPVAYIIHEAWFADLPFYVDERVLIPRSPFAELIQACFSPWVEAERVQKILELGTGSACMAIATAFSFPHAEIFASDISEAALEVAKINLKKHDLSDRIQLFKADLFAGLPKQTYDLIISNPPYVDLEDMQSLPAEYQHEPRLALESGVDGLDFVKRLLKEAPNYLNPNGVLIVEVGNSSGALVEAYPHLPFIWIELYKGGDGIFILKREDLL